MIRCAWCGARNYAIDMWCSRCKHHLDWRPARARRRFGALSVVAPAGAAIGVAIAVAMPAASFFDGSLRVAVAGLPNTGIVRAGSSEQARAASRAAAATVAIQQPAPTAEAAPSNSTPPADQAPPVVATPAPLSAAPPIVSVPARAVPTRADDPTATVDQFYAAVSAHRFAQAASLWSPQMQAAYPPTVYIDQRFSATQQIGVKGQRVLSDDGGTALVSVDLLELIGGQAREWVGTWDLVKASSGWLLNSPNLTGA